MVGATQVRKEDTVYRQTEGLTKTEVRTILVIMGMWIDMEGIFSQFVCTTDFQKITRGGFITPYY